MLSTVPDNVVRTDAGHHVGRIADADRGQVGTEDLRHDPHARQVGDGEARRGAGLQQLSRA